MSKTGGTLVMVGTGKGAFFFHGDKSRKDWTMTGPHLSGWEVSALHMDPRGRIFAGTIHMAYGATFRVSDDHGKTWQELKGRPEYPASKERKVKRIWQVVTSPHDPNTMYCGVDEAGLFVSRDRGESWREIESLTSGPNVKDWFPGGGGLCLHTILIDPKNANRIWIGISAVGFFRSDDGGKSWVMHNEGLPGMPTGGEGTPMCWCVHKFVLDPSKENTLYMQYHGGVMRSTNGGDSWSAIETGLPGNFGFPMVITKKGEIFISPVQSDEHRFFKDGKACVYRSTNGGQKWEQLSKGLPTEPQFAGVLRDAMAVDPHDPAGIYFGTTMGEVFYSRDSGESWNKLPGQFPRIEMVRAYAV